MKGAREGQPPLIRTFLASPAYRWHMFRSALKDIGKVFMVAMVLDTTYQILVLRAFYLGELLLVAVACAVVPYVVIRGPTALLMRRLYRSQSKPANQWAANPKEETEDHPSSTPKTDH
jgi:hypothetical protein